MKFLIETLDAFRDKLDSINSHLMVSNKKPEEIIPKLLSIDSKTHNVIAYQ